MFQLKREHPNALASLRILPEVVGLLALTLCKEQSIICLDKVLYVELELCAKEGWWRGTRRRENLIDS